MALRHLLIAAIPMLLGACGHTSGAGAQPTVEAVAEEEWRSVASSGDAAALDRISARWRAALAAARKRYRTRISEAGPLLDPEAGLPRATPGPGPYRCTLYRISPPGRRRTAFAASGEDFCFVGLGEEDRLTFTSELPARRVGGYLFEQKGAPALVFLGAEIGRGGEAASYGEEGAKHAVGIFERVGDLSYRLVLPEPDGGVHLIAMTPAPRE